MYSSRTSSAVWAESKYIFSTGDDYALSVRATADYSECPPALLSVAGNYGTLAAVRCLGRAGVRVTFADAELFAPARWSRFVSRRLTTPGIGEPERLIEWLLKFGKREPGCVLYPASDETAWLYSAYRDELADSFRLYQPSLDALHRLLDKKELHAVCQSVGLDVPETHFPASEADIEAIGRNATFPLLVKPTTHVFQRVHDKGRLVHRREDLLSTYRRVSQSESCSDMQIDRFPDAGRPMLQAFHASAEHGVYTVDGFVDAAGRMVTLGSMKILTRPRRLGIGFCFEEAPVRPELATALAALCRKVGYFGVFDAEFIEADGKFLLIDFNPRFYSSMAYEIDRGLPLPLLAYEAAIGRSDLMDALSGIERMPQGHVYTHRFLLELTTGIKRMLGRMSPEESDRWHRWLADNRERMTDAVSDRDDLMPVTLDVMRIVYGYARHPLSLIRRKVFGP